MTPAFYSSVIALLPRIVFPLLYPIFTTYFLPDGPDLRGALYIPSPTKAPVQLTSPSESNRVVDTLLEQSFSFGM
jgi:hypothetical protein